MSIDLGLKNTVKFFGRVDDDKLASLYADAMVFTHLVKDAPFGMQVVESMAAGTPVISWKPGGPEESISHDETGFLISQFDHNELMKHIELFLDDPDLSIKMGNASRERANKFFTSENIYKQIRNFMIQTMNNKIKK